MLFSLTLLISVTVVLPILNSLVTADKVQPWSTFFKHLASLHNMLTFEFVEELKVKKSVQRRGCQLQQLLFHGCVPVQ